ncbi:hypothetical protein [Hyalangium sp.]|uniref:hypothetical protein n=1 Tax=Hyalangium sp. TaxID=2028555 RepID=UPI002D326374|nr:hypothetical protein [Hyalangium sp.]HYI02881.1 hypothetical protein [Hyalangium sp.]
MTDEELSRALRGREPPLNPEHQARLEQELLAAYDVRVGHPDRRGRSPWLRYATAAGFLLCLVTATQVTAEYKVEVGKRIRLMLQADQLPPPGLGEKVAHAFLSKSSRVVDIKVMVRRAPDGSATLVVDVWGDQLVQDGEGLQRLRALPELSGTPVEVTSLEGRVRDNLFGVVGHSLFRAGASPEEQEQARQRLIEELRRQEGEGAEIDVDVSEDPQKVRVRVRKRAHEPPLPSP